MGDIDREQVTKVPLDINILIYDTWQSHSAADYSHNTLKVLPKTHGTALRRLAHPDVGDDQQRHRGQQFHVLFALAVGRDIGQFFQPRARCAVQYAAALLDERVPDAEFSEEHDETSTRVSALLKLS
jgi:hypothetical protein